MIVFGVNVVTFVSAFCPFRIDCRFHFSLYLIVDVRLLPWQKQVVRLNAQIDLAFIQSICQSILSSPNQSTSRSTEQSISQIINRSIGEHIS